MYVTISTGIGIGLVENGSIETATNDLGGRIMLVEFQGKHVPWESFASGHAIVERYGKQASQIDDDATWKRICHDLGLGLIELSAVLEPEVIVFGGSVGTYFKRYRAILQAELETYKTPLLHVPDLRQAARPEEAVLFGCYELARSIYPSAAGATH